MFFYVFLNIFYIDMLKVSQQNNTKSIIVIFEKIKKLSSNCIPKRYLNEFSFFLFSLVTVFLCEGNRDFIFFRIGNYATLSLIN